MPISSKKLFETKNEFINSELINSKKGGIPQKWYNLDAIMSLEYRINSKEATQFHQLTSEFSLHSFEVEIHSSFIYSTSFI